MTPPAPTHVPTVTSQARSIEDRLGLLLQRLKAVKAALHNTPEPAAPVSTTPPAASCLHSSLMWSSDCLRDAERLVGQIEEALAP